MKERVKRYSFIKGQNGFTLVELMVVLAILAILSSVAVFSIIGYIDQARFDKNEQNAQSMYQAVQGALERKKNSGEVEDWIVNELMAKGTQDPYDTSANPNHDKDAAGNVADQCYAQDTFNNFPRPENTVGDSVHMRYFLTYTKGATGGDNAVIMDLVGRYFYDTTILDATFTIEFDVEKILGGDEETHYAVNTYAVFYDEKRTGWDAEALKVTSTEVPWRDSAYRSDTSLVGYYNGGHPGAVDSVYTPIVNNKMTFAELAMRNSEKLELSFSAVNGAEQITGTGKYNVHYTASIYEQLSDSEEKWMADLVISEAYMANGTPNGNAPVDWTKLKPTNPNVVQNGAMQMVNIDGTGKTWPVVYSYEHMTDDQNKPFIRIKASTETMALVYVNTEGHDNFDYNTLPANKLSGGFFRFPMTVSYVIKKYSETDVKEYVSYSIALDAMMSRSAAYSARQDAAKKEYNYSIRRLLLPDGKEADGSDRISPKNINVSMIVAEDAFTDENLAQYNKPSNLPASESKKAKRAYDDPVYLLGDGNYAYREDASIRDQYAGHAVCNTYFGDLGEGSTGSGSATEQLACITAFRHLYNMRYTTEFAAETDVAYCIERDLNWYRKVGEDYTSEVEVYDLIVEEVTTGGNNGGNNGNHYGWGNGNGNNGNGNGNGNNNGNGGNGNHYGWGNGNGNNGNNTGGGTTQYFYLQGFSPVGIQNRVVSNNELKLVSWPALPVMGSNQSLLAKEYILDDGTAKTPVIRNVQMRKQSFLPTDEGLGMICVNNGAVSNLRCENLCLTLTDMEDGEALDLARVQTAVSSLATSGISQEDTGSTGLKGGIPVGGLIGWNKNGSLGWVNNGAMGEKPENKDNAIWMSNTVVLCGENNDNGWCLFKGFDSVGGVVGKHSSSQAGSGSVMTIGNFAVSGYKNTGGIIGAANADVNAYLVADSGSETSVEVFDQYHLNHQDVDCPAAGSGCVVVGKVLVGGAIGSLSQGSLAQEGTDLVRNGSALNAVNYSSDADGVVTITEPEKAMYGVSVHLSKGSCVWQYGTEASEGVGGAIGKIFEYGKIDGNPANLLLSIKSINEGTILSGSNNSGKYIGGAVGLIQDGSAAKIFISANNAGNIGIKADTDVAYGKAVAAAAGVAYFKNFGKSNDVYVFDVNNSGKIYCDITNNSNGAYKNAGVGIAIGAFMKDDKSASLQQHPTMQVKAVNSGTVYGWNTSNSGDWNGNNSPNFGIGGAVGFLYELQGGSHVYSVLKEASEISAQGNHVGGAVGYILKETKGTTADPLTITAELENGSRVFSEKGSNIGGCVGSLRMQSDYSEIRTFVKGDTEIYGYLNVGGVIGCVQQEGHGSDTNLVKGAGIELHGASEAPILHVMASTTSGDPANIKADNRNVGGMVGVVAPRNGPYSTEMVFASQTANDKLILDVKGGQNVGGMAGFFRIKDMQGSGHHKGTSASVSYSVTLDPRSTIYGMDTAIGGAIGRIEDDTNANPWGTFASDVTVKYPAGTVSREAGQYIVSGKMNVGGVVGYTYVSTITGDLSCEINASNAVYGTGRVGGVLGYGQKAVLDHVDAKILAADALYLNHRIKADGKTEGGTEAGGCIGTMDSVTVTGNITSSLEETHAIYGKGRVGGAIGCAFNSTILSAQTLIGATEAIYGEGSEVGGCIGRVNSDANGTTAINAVSAVYGTTESAIVGSPIYSTGGSVGGCIGFVSGSHTLVQDVAAELNVTGELISAPEARKDGYGGVVGCIKDNGCKVESVRLAGTGLELNLPKAYYAGGLVGQITDFAVVERLKEDLADNASVSITADAFAGGYVGLLSKSTIGRSDEPLSINKVLKITTLAGGSRDSGGTGGFIGAITGSANVSTGVADYSEVKCAVELTLGVGSYIKGGLNTGGAIGLAAYCNLDKDITVHLNGGEVMSNHGALGGAIGSLQCGVYDPNGAIKTVCQNVTTTIDYDYQAIGWAPIHAITKIEEPGVGGVIGQLGGWKRGNDNGQPDGVHSDRKQFIETGKISLVLAHDFVLKDGKSSMGGVVGQCESNHATLGGLTIKSSDGVTNHRVVVRNLQNNDYYDIGGIIGYMYGTLKGEISANNALIEVYGQKYVGGWIGGFDGTIGSKGGTAYTMEVKNIVAVNGKKQGVGGLIGAAGVWHGTGNIYYHVNADLTGATITTASSGDNGAGVGGVIGLLGDPWGAHPADNHSAKFYGNMTVTLSGTKITGGQGVGGIFGYTRRASDADESYTYKAVVNGDSSITANGDGAGAGGLVGTNNAAFVPNTEIEIAAGAKYTINASKGYGGGIMGRNDYLFGKDTDQEFDIPSNGSGILEINAKTEGAILGYNAKDAVCGRFDIVDSDDGYVWDDGTLKYTSHVRIDEPYDTTWDRPGFVGKNDGSIQFVVMDNDQGYTHDDPPPEETSGNTSNGEETSGEGQNNGEGGTGENGGQEGQGTEGNGEGTNGEPTP